MTVEEMLYDMLSQMTPEQLKHQNPNVREWYDHYQGWRQMEQLRKDDRAAYDKIIRQSIINGAVTHAGKLGW